MFDPDPKNREGVFATCFIKRTSLVRYVEAYHILPVLGHGGHGVDLATLDLGDTKTPDAILCVVRAGQMIGADGSSPLKKKSGRITSVFQREKKESEGITEVMERKKREKRQLWTPADCVT